jgi:hypothetical protein
MALIEQRKSTSGSVDANQEPRPLGFRTMQPADDGSQRRNLESPLFPPRHRRTQSERLPPWLICTPSSSMSVHHSNSAYAGADLSIHARPRRTPRGQKALTPTTLTVQTSLPSLRLTCLRSGALRRCPVRCGTSSDSGGPMVRRTSSCRSVLFARVM